MRRLFQQFTDRYRFGRRPPRSGLGGEDPFTGWAKNSETSTTQRDDVSQTEAVFAPIEAAYQPIGRNKNVRP